MDVYPKSWKSMLHWKYFLRPITRRLDSQMLYRIVKWYAPKLMPLARVLYRWAGKAGRRLVPIMDQSDKDLPVELQRDWTILDTYDALSAAYDQPQTAEVLRCWFEESGFTQIQIESGLMGRGIAP